MNIVERKQLPRQMRQAREYVLRSAYVFYEEMRRMSRPAPYEMTRGLGRAPRGYRYVVVGGHVVMVDDGYRVHDSIRFEINVGH